MAVLYHKNGIYIVMKKNNNGKIQNFVKSTNSPTGNSGAPTGNSGAANLPPIRDSYMYIETSSNNYGQNVFVSFERTDIIQIS